MFSRLVILFFIELHAQNNNFKRTLKNGNGLLTVRLWVINDFESEICPMMGVNINGDGNDEYDHNIYDEEFYLQKVPRPRTPGTPRRQTIPSVILDSPPGISTLGREIKILP